MQHRPHHTSIAFRLTARGAVRAVVGLAVLSVGAMGAGCPPPAEIVDEPIPLPFSVPDHFPAPRLPADNIPTAEAVELGRRLFFDVRLSANETQSCGSCHLTTKAFADGKPTPLGSTGDVVPRNAMALANVAWFSSLTWANPILETLESQALVPLFAEHPDAIELGITTVVPEVEERFRQDPEMVAAFEAAFPRSKNDDGDSGDEDVPSDDVSPVSIGNAVKAIASYERSLVSGDSRYDRFVYGGESDALTDQEKQGLVLFNSERAECYHCHGGTFFTSATVAANSVVTESGFENNGVYDVDAQDVDVKNLGLFNITNQPRDKGRFRVPTLRNIALTGPYMHDGSLATLADVVAHYTKGGTQSARQSELVQPLDLTAEEQAALVAFMGALTDDTFVAAHADDDREARAAD